MFLSLLKIKIYNYKFCRTGISDEIVKTQAFTFSEHPQLVNNFTCRLYEFIIRKPGFDVFFPRINNFIITINRVGEIAIWGRLTLSNCARLFSCHLRFLLDWTASNWIDKNLLLELLDLILMGEVCEGGRRGVIQPSRIQCCDRYMSNTHPLSGACQRLLFAVTHDSLSSTIGVGIVRDASLVVVIITGLCSCKYHCK